MDNSSSFFIVLIVDDDPDDQMLIEEAFAALKCNAIVHCIQSSVDLLKWLESNVRPDLITLDLNMPILDGFGALVNLKSSKTHNTIPVFMLSTSSPEEDKLEAKKLGAEDFFVKPHTFGSLKKIAKEMYFRSLVSTISGR